MTFRGEKCWRSCGITLALHYSVVNGGLMAVSRLASMRDQTQDASLAPLSDEWRDETLACL